MNSSTHFAKAIGLLNGAIDGLKDAALAQKAEGTGISESGRSVAVARTQAETALLWANKAAQENGR